MSTVDVPLSRGYTAIVDAVDAPEVLIFKWYALSVRRNIYAARNVKRPDGSRSTVLMHKQLTGYAITDHVNGDGLDNRRFNLREATVGDNCRNQRRPKNNTSGYKGVHWYKRDGKWRAQISAVGRHVHLGSFALSEDAARAYDAAAREMHGEFATLNFPVTGERAA